MPSAVPCRHRSRPVPTLLAAAAVLLTLGGGLARGQTTPSDELRQMTLAELLDVQVELVSRQPQSLALAPAAIEVITAEDIRRSGATSLPEALRLVPGVHVARIDANKWAVGIRGFTDRLARSMLVLIDGRPVYSPLFAGTFWEAQDTLLYDIDRIEVVRGPGGTLWGANAMTGIINVVTKSAAATQGLLLSGATGSAEPAHIAGRFGGTRGEAFSYRLYGKALARSAGVHPDSDGGAVREFDAADLFQVGARAEWTFDGGRQFALFGDVYDSRAGQRDVLTTYEPPASRTTDRDVFLRGGNIVGRWSGALGPTGGFRLQVSFDRSSRDEPAFREVRDTLDIDFQHSRGFGLHELIWGAAYRRSSGEPLTAGSLRFYPPAHTSHVSSAFLQSDIDVVPERLRISTGLKLERNSYSGLEAQPSARLLWTPAPADTVVLSMTRAVRTPSRVERDFETGSLLDPTIPLFVRVIPNPEFRTESLIAYEAGYRRRFANLFVTASAFYNRHQQVLSLEVDPRFTEPGTPPRQILPVSFGNSLSGHSHGLELTSDLRMGAWSRIEASYSTLTVELRRNPGSRDIGQEARWEGSAPRHQGHLRLALDLPRGWTIDWFLRGTSTLESLDVPGYVTMDARVAKLLGDRLELSVVGKNLNDRQHLEFPGDSAAGNVEIPRSVRAQLIWWP